MKDKFNETGATKISKSEMTFKKKKTKKKVDLTFQAHERLVRGN